MTLVDLLTRARMLMVSRRWPASAAFRALEEAAGGPCALVADALEALDALTPHPWTFLTWADGGAFHVEGDAMGIVYRYDRKAAEVLAVLGRAAQRAWGAEQKARP